LISSPELTLTGELSVVMPLGQQFQLATPHAPAKSAFHPSTGWRMLTTSWLSSKPGKKYTVWPSLEVGAGGTVQVAVSSPYEVLVVTLAYSI
jgi:hypothetical protein